MWTPHVTIRIPKTVAEGVFVTMAMVVGSGLYAYIIGEVCGILAASQPCQLHGRPVCGAHGGFHVPAEPIEDAEVLEHGRRHGDLCDEIKARATRNGIRLVYALQQDT